MQSGDLRDRVGFYRRIEADDGAGNVTSAFSPFAEFEIAAKIVAKFGGEAIQASRLAGRSFDNITVRACVATRQVTPDWQVRNVRSGEVYNIRSIVDPDRRCQWIEMLCEKGVAT